MPDDIRPVGSGSDTSSGIGSRSASLSEFLRTLHEADVEQVNLEEQLQSLRITNVQNLGNLKRSQQNELLEELAQREAIILDKIQEQRLKAIEEEYEAKIKLAEGEEKERLKRELKHQQELIKKETEARKKEKKIEDKEKAAAAKKEAKQKYKSELGLRDTQNQGVKNLGKALSAKMYTIDENGNRVEAGKGASAAGRLVNLVNVLGDLTRQLDNTIDKIGGYKGAIDTRLQGSKNKTKGSWQGESYWDQMSGDITSIAAVSPFIKQSALAERINEYVGKGIAFNVEQRAVIQELSGKIATTFDAANGTLLRLIRIQQQDTTAGRLGMESALTAFLNNMYETTEYMNSIATTIKGSLEEAMSLMTGENALSFEYQVQKWLGSMYSVGMSETAVQGIGGVLGKLAAGQLEGITSGGQGNLVIMAANQAGMNITDILNNGLDANTTNQLMNAMVDYLSKIYEEAGDSKVIQQQMANVYGVTAADLKAAVNLAKSAGVVSRDGLTYASAMSRLNYMADTLYQRTSMGEMMNNMWDNVKYTMSAGIANNPAMYALYKAANLLSDTTGGIDIPLPLVMGSGMNMGLNVANLMRVGAMSGGILGSIGNIVSGIGNSFSGSKMLKQLGVGNGLTTVSRGSGQGLKTAGGMSVSSSGANMVGNASGSDVQDATLTDAKDSARAETAAAVDESEETKLSDIQSDIVNIYTLLQAIAEGNYTIKVDSTGSEVRVSNLQNPSGL